MPVKRAEQRCGDAGDFCLNVRESGHQMLSICFMTNPAEVSVWLISLRGHLCCSSSAGVELGLEIALI